MVQEYFQIGNWVVWKSLYWASLQQFLFPEIISTEIDEQAFVQLTIC